MLQSLYIYIIGTLAQSSSLAWTVGLQREYGLFWYSERHWDGMKPLLEVWAVTFLQYCILRISAGARNSQLFGITLSREFQGALMISPRL